METTAAAAGFAALSQETRLDLMRLLIAEGASGLPAGEIAARLAVPSSTLSFHLAALERAGLTQATRQGRQIVHAARLIGVRQLLTFLTETCCSGHPELCGDLARLLPPIPEESAVHDPRLQRVVPVHAKLGALDHGRGDPHDGSAAAGFTLIPRVRTRRRNRCRRSSPSCKPSATTWRHCTANLGMCSQVPKRRGMDFVIALCDTLDDQLCPDFGDKAVTGAWPMPDPAKFTGSAAERSTLLNELYASLRRRIEIFISLPFASLDRMALSARLDEIGEGPVGVLARSGGG